MPTGFVKRILIFLQILMEWKQVKLTLTTVARKFREIRFQEQKVPGQNSRNGKFQEWKIPEL